MDVCKDPGSVAKIQVTADLGCGADAMAVAMRAYADDAAA